jgi:integrase/recombinase XerD
VLKVQAHTTFPEALTDEQVAAVLACCRRPRDRFMVVVLRVAGLRIGEALGLRRADMHLLPDSRGLGCTVVGAHVHVQPRANPNGALAKSRSPRTVPASDAVLAAYAGATVSPCTAGQRRTARASWRACLRCACMFP